MDSNWQVSHCKRQNIFIWIILRELRYVKHHHFTHSLRFIFQMRISHAFDTEFARRQNKLVARRHSDNSPTERHRQRQRIKSVIRVWSLFNGFSCQKKCCTDLIYPSPRSSLVSLLRNLSPVPRCTDRTTKTAKSFTQSNFACRRTKSRSNEKWCALCCNETCEMIIILLQLA